MKIVISSGHGLHVRGASGPPPWGLDEVDEARRVVEQVAKYLRDAGIDTATYHDNVSHSQNENLNRIVDFHNSQARDLDVSVHFNAYNQTSEPMGTECLWVTQQTLAAAVSLAISDAGDFPDRGAKNRTDLFFLNNTEEPAVLIETCFVDSSYDAEQYRLNFEAICGAMAAALAGEDVEVPDRPERPPPDRPEQRRSLEEGDEGEDVATLQRSLGIPDDGDFGPATDSWVRSFQGAFGGTQDGEVGPTTWGEVDKLDAKVIAGNDGLSPELEHKIDILVERSGIADLDWSERGTAPHGYYAGMAKTYALALARWQAGDPALMVMAQREMGNEDIDALTWYDDEFEDEEMANDEDGINTLRHLFVMMVGLGMRESSGNSWEGRDVTADNVEADTCEAGLFQTSWNIRSCSDTIAPLLPEYWANPNGFRETFVRGQSNPTSSQLDCYGSGDGARYQWLSRYAPAFHVLVTGVGMRRARQHWGPLNRREVDIVSEVDALLMAVEQLTGHRPGDAV